MTTAKTSKDPQISEYLIRVLTNTGLSENQACVYLACLKLGNASVWDISETSGVKRTTCYVVMKYLVSKGIASVSGDNKRAIYSVISPNEFIFSFKNKQNQLTESVSELNALISKTHSRPHVRMFEGIDGIERAYKLTLNALEDSEILIYGNPNVVISYQNMIDDYLRQRVLKKIKVRVILPDIPLAQEIMKKDEEQLRQTRLLPKNTFDQQTEMNILPDSIIYIAHSENRPFATVVESPTLAKEEKGRFEILWNIAKI